jgi:hypothetical protein
MNEPRPSTHPAGVQPHPHAPARPQVAPPLAANAHPPAAPQIKPPVRHEPNLDPIALEGDDEESPAAAAAPKIKMQVLGMSSGLSTHKTQFKRHTFAGGQGACRVRTFHGRLSDEGMAYMDDKVNEWLDEHPDIEVKFVNTAIGLYDGKIKEPALIMNVWY